ncbi:MAG: hypothetical protein H7Y38_13000 [Armatimonadetes bacterium]|nr:hypothetical protein [Armatimonadota bacterium]
MPSSALAVFEQLPSPGNLLSVPPLEESLQINAHIHLPPNFSAFDSVAQAVELARSQGIHVLGASNYYDYAVYAPFAQAARESGIFPLFGIEIITMDNTLRDAGTLTNDPGNPGKMYICGKGIMRFDPLTPEAARLLNEIRGRDSERMAQMTTRLAAVFAEAGLDTGLSADAVKARVVARHGSPLETVYLQERHVAQAFQEIIFERVAEGERAALLARAFGVAPKSAPDNANALQNEIRSALMKAGKPAFVPETFVDDAHAFALILALGGIPCYPTLADGTSPVCGFETPVGDWVARLHERDFHCAEFIPLRNTPEVLAQYVRAARNAGIVVTAGTEHNTRDLLPIAPACVNGAPILPETATIFEEGACVVAAHQYLTARGEPGFVDENNVPHEGFDTAEERIAYFARLGKAVIAAYRA